MAKKKSSAPRPRPTEPVVNSTGLRGRIADLEKEADRLRGCAQRLATDTVAHAMKVQELVADLNAVGL